MKSNRDLYVKLAIALFAIVLIVCLVVIGLHAFEKYIAGGGDDNRSTYGHITYDGKTYAPRTDITTFLMIGVDETGEVTASGDTKNSKMADFITLFVFDKTNKKCTLIHINRDTMMEVPVLGPMGDKAGTRYQQIAYAHTYGSGTEDSCRNTANAVSALLGGVPVNNYISLTMDSVAIANDMVGGVEVEVLDDFSMVDEDLVKGSTVRLMGDQALTYVRGRHNVGDQSNLARMARQKQYMRSFSESLRNAYNANNNIMVDISRELGDYMVTDSSVNDLSRFAEYISSYELAGVISPEGESVKGEKYMEHKINEKALRKMVVEYFYREVK